VQQNEVFSLAVIAKQLVLLKQDQALRSTSLIEMASNASQSVPSVVFIEHPVS